jgi:VIT1/CCC1 family predicted Fe2+/Mn2+ transporter
VLPLAVAAVTSVPTALWAVPATALIFLAALGAIAARAGGAAMATAAARVTFWGALAMAATAGIGQLFGTIVQ